jgi:hypothetical protein
MLLYQYLCTNCDTLNQIHWTIDEDYQAPYCCECGERYAFVFKKILEVKDAN